MNASIKELLEQDFSPPVAFHLTGLMFPQAWQAFEHPVPETKGGHQITRLGQVVCSGTRPTKTDVILVRVAGDIRIRRNQVGLRKLVDSYMDGVMVSGVLAFYYQPGHSEWRLSYAWRRAIRASGKTELVATMPSRCSYVLGPQAKTRTAAERLSRLASLARPSPADIEQAFSVEAVSKVFFDTYRQHYLAFVAEISNPKIRSLLQVPQMADSVAQQLADKPLRDFAKKLMGRLVFLKFVEKKGWLGASEFAKHDGQADFLLRLFKQHKENFYAEALVPLFFETLNQARPDDVFALTGTKIPYLNGGLFEPAYDVDRVNRQLRFKGGLFDAVLNFFDQYNFTIDENDDSDAEIGVDPEMLGRIFEQLIEDNEKDMQGTIYTPYEVVRFMCRHSLLLHLCRTLTVEADSPTGQAIKRLIIEQDVGGLDADQQAVLVTALKDIKVLDPAIGSGAFPMGMLRELLHARAALEDSHDHEQLKREIIRHSLYGVDIDPGAVDIARLRFFLSLVVDCQLPEPLPNLDFKIMQGDSLSEAFEDVPVVFDVAEYRKHSVKESDGLFETGELERLNQLKRKSAAQIMKESGQDVLALLDAYYDPQAVPAQKHDSREAIEDLELQTIRRALEHDVAARKADYDKAERKAKLDPSPRNQKNRDVLQTLVVQAQDRIQRLDEFGASDRRVRPWFLWHYYFHEVFEQGGFDIIIGNPPYRANQENENDQAKNKVYPLIHKRIKDTFVAKSTAQKTKAYDLFSCFFRLVMDLSLNSPRQAIISFITNYAFIGARTYDGFRADVRENFGQVTVVNLGGDVRANPRLSGPVNSIFGIQAGVAVSFFEPVAVTKKKKLPFRLHYTATEEEATREEKIEFIGQYEHADLPFYAIVPDEKENWINQSDSDFYDLMPLCSKEAKKGNGEDSTVFQLFSFGIVTARDEWVYDFNLETLASKVKFLIDIYCNEQNTKGPINTRENIKWSRAVKKDLRAGRKYEFVQKSIRLSMYRPFVKELLYYSKELNEMRYQMGKIFPDDSTEKNPSIGLQYGSRLSFTVCLSDVVPNYSVFSLDPCLWAPLYRYEDGQRIDNITDWALRQFQTHYADPAISKQDIFYYVYAVLHDPVYRQKYAVDLKQDYPRLPWYGDFGQWRDWGRELMDLHIGFESVAPETAISYVEAPAKAKEAKTHSAGYTKDANGDKVFDGSVTFCDGSGLAGIPLAAFDYKLGNKSAIEWILDQYIAPSYPTDEEVASGKRKLREDERVLRDRFNTFRFADYKDKVIDLIRRVATVSVRTVEIQSAMRQQERN